MRNISTTDEVRVKKALTTVFLTVAAVGMSFFAIKSNNPIIYVLLFAAPAAVLFFARPVLLLLLVYATQYANFSIPGLPGGLTASEMLRVAVVGWAVLTLALSKERIRKVDASSFYLFLFMVNMFVIIGVRGFGLGFLGSDSFGGNAYIRLVISLLFFLTAPIVKLSEKHIRSLFFLSVLLPLIPFFVQLSLYVTGGATAGLGRFFNVSAETVLEATALAGETENVRWSSAGSLGSALITLALVVPAIRRKKALSYGVLGIAVCLILFTGSRGALFATGVFLFVWILYSSRKRMLTLVLLLFVGLMAWGGILAILPSLPHAAQRTLSFLPFAAERMTDAEALRSAQNSIDFRLEIWGYAWTALPQYLLIGRGLLLEVAGWAWLQSHWYARPEFFYAGHAYHSGPLSLLVDFGIPGIIFAIGFMVSVGVKAWRCVQKYCRGKEDLLSLFYAFLSIKFIYSLFSFFLVYGSVRKNLPTIILTAVLLEVFRKVLAEREEQEKAAEASAIGDQEETSS